LVWFNACHVRGTPTGVCTGQPHGSTQEAVTHTHTQPTGSSTYSIASTVAPSPPTHPPASQKRPPTHAAGPGPAPGRSRGGIARPSPAPPPCPLGPQTAARWHPDHYRRRYHHHHDYDHYRPPHGGQGAASRTVTALPTDAPARANPGACPQTRRGRLGWRGQHGTVSVTVSVAETGTGCVPGCGTGRGSGGPSGGGTVPDAVPPGCLVPRRGTRR
jgi:hypothetical protein